MIYFDTDVLVNYLIEQDAAKHRLAIQLLEQAAAEENFFVSLLALEETAFVLAKLKTEPATIVKMVDRLLPYADVGYDRSDFLRARDLARNVGFQNMSDCLHTAIAETHCTELYTFNKADFKRIQRHTSLKITILESSVM